MFRDIRGLPPDVELRCGDLLPSGGLVLAKDSGLPTANSPAPSVEVSPPLPGIGIGSDISESVRVCLCDRSGKEICRRTAAPLRTKRSAMVSVTSIIIYPKDAKPSRHESREYGGVSTHRR